MNRLSPLIQRRGGPLRPRSAGRAGQALAIALPLATGAEPAAWLEDLRLFATGWIGGLIFFGTLLS